MRRTWECPQCGRSTRLHGWFVSRRCNCQKGGVWMRLIDDPPPMPDEPTGESTESESEKSDETKTEAAASPPHPPSASDPAEKPADASSG